MDYEFGDIIDCRKTPSIKHFILIVGLNNKKEVMYYIITSKTYKVFKNVLDFFNDCIEKKNPRFYHFFSKEEKDKRIYPTGNLCDAFFLDQHTNYQLCFEKDSMILINSEPDLADKAVVDEWITDHKAEYKSRLCRNDSEKLVHAIQLSDNVSPRNKSEV